MSETTEDMCKAARRAILNKMVLPGPETFAALARELRTLSAHILSEGGSSPTPGDHKSVADYAKWVRLRQAVEEGDVLADEAGGHVIVAEFMRDLRGALRLVALADWASEIANELCAEEEARL